MIVNSELMKKIKGMHIDEDRIALNISDHNLVRAWFNIGKEEEARSQSMGEMEKTKYETIEWYKRDHESLIKNEENLESMLGQISGFNRTMKKLRQHWKEH